MNITANLVRVGDYINNFGFVTKVRYFYRDRANKTKTNPLSNKFVRISSSGQYARMVAEQHDSQYEKVLDCVVLYSDGNSKCFPVDSEVKVYRLREAV